LAELNRFPIEPLAGETVNIAPLDRRGLVGDRAYELFDLQSGEAVSAEALARLSGWAARYLDDIVPGDLDAWARVRAASGREYPFSDPAWLEEVSRDLRRGVGARRRTADGPAVALRILSRPTLRLAERTYGGPIGPARLRANLVFDINGDARAFAEEAWIGRKLRVGDGLLEVLGPSGDSISAHPGPDATGDVDLLRGLIHVRGGHLGVAARVLSGQRLRIGDTILLAD
jgi:uncharacterized protein